MSLSLNMPPPGRPHVAGWAGGARRTVRTSRETVAWGGRRQALAHRAHWWLGHAPSSVWPSCSPPAAAQAPECFSPPLPFAFPQESRPLLLSCSHLLLCTDVLSMSSSRSKHMERPPPALCGALPLKHPALGVTLGHSSGCEHASLLDEEASESHLAPGPASRPVVNTLPTPPRPSMRDCRAVGLRIFFLSLFLEIVIE